MEVANWPLNKAGRFGHEHSRNWICDRKISFWIYHITMILLNGPYDQTQFLKNSEIVDTL